MDDQIQCKLYAYYEENGKPEVRRFDIKGDRNAYAHLTAKIQDVYPVFKTKPYSVAWRDEDGDDVTISSDEELQIAIASMKSFILIKLYVYSKTGPKDVKDDVNIVFSVSGSEDANKSNQVLHYGVMCDNCDSVVVGFRYKCTVCEDYDLCSRCENAGRHAEHCMVRVPTPSMPHTVIKAAVKRSRHFLKTVATAVGNECPYKKNRRDRSGDRKHRGHHGDRHHGDHPRGPRKPHGTWIDTFANYMNEFANLAGDIGLDTPTNNVRAAQQAQASASPDAPTEAGTTADASNEAGATNSAKEREAKATTSQENQQSAQSENSQGNQQRLPSENEPRCPFNVQPSDINPENVQKLVESFLTGNLGAFLSQMSQSCASSEPEVNVDQEIGQGDRKSQESDRVSVQSEASSTSSVESKKEASPEKIDGWTVINKEKDLMDAYVTGGAPLDPTPPIGFNLPEEFQSRMNISGGQSLYPPLNTATAVLSPKEPERPSAPSAPIQPEPVQKQPQPAQSGKQPAQSEQQPAQASQPQAQPRPRHQKAHIEAAIKQMHSMGFKGDWLVELLERKDGNIAAVLDLLSPISKSK